MLAEQLVNPRKGAMLIGVALLVVAALATAGLVNPLPSDEIMLEHFRAHRPQIEQLVTHFRNYERRADAPNDWNDLHEIVVLRASAGVRDVYQVGATWIAEPYSAESANYLFKLAKTDGRAYLALARRSGSLSIRMSDPKYGPRMALVRTSIAVIWKDLFFFPQPPRVDGQRLWQPADIDGEAKSSDRILNDLTTYPAGWKKGECVYRSIDPQWFMRMCWGAT